MISGWFPLIMIRFNITLREKIFSAIGITLNSKVTVLEGSGKTANVRHGSVSKVIISLPPARAEIED